MSGTCAKQVREIRDARASYQEALAQVESAREDLHVICHSDNMSDDAREAGLESLFAAQDFVKKTYAIFVDLRDRFIASYRNRNSGRALRLAA